jgi:hypothetical protein
MMYLLAALAPTLAQCAGVAGPTFIKGVDMGASLESTLEALDGPCGETQVIAAEQPRYPLAAHFEVHLTCDGYSGGPLAFEKAAFVFADNELAQVEAHGVDMEAARTLLGVADGSYADMENYQDGQFWTDSRDKRLLWLSEAAIHPNLFAWPNPHLGNEPASGGNDSSRIPALLDFSSNLEDLQPVFEQQCRQLVVHGNERVWLPNAPDHQVQLDCFGYSYAGFERKLEAVFGDGKLHVIWVLTGKPEEKRLRDQLVRDWGEPSVNNENWEVYGEGKISLRKDLPELLILSDEMIPLYQEEFRGG